MKPSKLITIEHFLCVVAAMLLTWGGGFSAFADYSSTVLSKNPIGFWQLNETNQPMESVATNYGSLGAAGDGYYLNGVTPVASPIAGDPGETAPKFDGFSQKIEVPYNAALNPATSFSVEAWVKPECIDGYNNSWYRSVIKSCSGVNLGGYMLMFNAGSTTTPDVFKFTLYTGGTGVEVYNSGGILATNGVWAHMVGTWSSSDQTAHLYIDGVEQATAVIPYVPNTNTLLRIAAGGTQEAMGESFDPGAIAQVAVYSNQLSASQVLAHYEAGINASSNYTATIMADHPVAYWPLNETSVAAPPVATNLGTLGAALDGKYCLGSYLGGTIPGESGPRPPNYAGFETNNDSVYTESSKAGFVMVPPVNVHSNNVMTIAAWIKRDGFQLPNATIFGTRMRGNEKASFNFNGANGLGYNWADVSSTYNYNPGLTVPDQLWTFAGLVITPTNAVIYMDDGSGLIARTNNVANAVTNSGGQYIYVHPAYIGIAGNSDIPGRYFNGNIDDVAVFTNALSYSDMLELRTAAFGSAPPFILAQPTDRPVMLGGKAPFTCLAGAGTAELPMSFQLLKDGVPVGPATSSTTLTYSNVQPADLASTFNVVVTGASSGSVTSSPASLIRWTTPGSYSGLVESLRPAAYYRFSAASGTPVYDIANALDGSMGGSATRTNGPAPTGQVGFLSGNNAMDISSTAYGYATVLGPAVDTQTNTVTITLWFYPTSASQSAFSGLYYTRGLGTNANNYVGLQIDRSGGEQLSFAWSAAPNPYDWHTGIYVSPDEWNFIAVVVNQTNAAMYDYTATYGWQQATINQTFPPPVNLGVGNATAIGADPNFLTSRYCKGAFDEVAVFNKALSQDEIYKLASAGFNVNLSILPMDSSHNLVGWSYGTLQSADSILGPWTPVSGAVVPSYTNTISGDQKYFRAAY